MEKSKDAMIDKNELENMINSIGEKVSSYVNSLKKQSAEEILNGSLEEAQEIIGQILPIEYEYKQIEKSHASFLKVLNRKKTPDSQANSKQTSDSSTNSEQMPDSPTNIEQTPDSPTNIEQTLDSPANTEVSEKSELNKLDLSDMDFTSNDTYRVPILKALIYLGGSAKLNDVTGFIEKEMRNKFKSADQEKGTNGFEKLWIEMVNTEKENLVSEGLIEEDKSGEQWEIVQNGIDYLSQHAN